MATGIDAPQPNGLCLRHLHPPFGRAFGEHLPWYGLSRTVPGVQVSALPKAPFRG
jgi:hypothetical protein